MSDDRLAYIKKTLDKQKNRPAVVLRRADAEWVVEEVERLSTENRRLKEVGKQCSH
jgi:hypothetical protein